MLKLPCPQKLEQRRTWCPRRRKCHSLPQNVFSIFVQTDSEDYDGLSKQFRFYTALRMGICVTRDKTCEFLLVWEHIDSKCVGCPSGETVRRWSPWTLKHVKGWPKANKATMQAQHTPGPMLTPSFLFGWVRCVSNWLFLAFHIVAPLSPSQ